MKRNETKSIRIGSVTIGGGAPIAVQSMCNTHTADIEATLNQIARLHELGCEIIRLAVPDAEAAEALKTIVPRSPIPVVADIHFDHRLALLAAEAGVHKIRINPGNIGDQDNVRKVAEASRDPDPHRRQRRQSGKAPARKIRAPHARGAGGVRAGTHRPAAPL